MKRSSLKRLLALFMQAPLSLLTICLLSIAQVWLTVLLPVFIGQAVDQLGQVHQTVFISLLQQMVLVLVLSALIQWILPLLVNRLVYGRMAVLRLQLYTKLHTLPLSYLDGQSVGDVVSRFATDLEQLTNGLLLFFSQLLIGVLTIGATLLSMARLHGTMMLLVVVLTPLSLVLSRLLAQKSYASFQQQAAARGQQGQLLEETIRQLSLIQAYNAQDELSQLFERETKTYAGYSQTAIFLSSTVNPTTRFINALIYAFLAAYGAWRIILGQLTVGELMTFLQYATQYSKPFTDISSVLAELQSAKAGVERLYAIVDQEDEVDSVDCLPMGQLEGAITFRQVSFRYQADKPLIDHLDLSIPAGARVAIVGPTGAGKSTLINLLMRFYEPDSGQILVDGVDIRRYSKSDWRRQIGMVLQETWLGSGTIHQVIAYAHPKASRARVQEAAQAAEADFFIQQLEKGYDTSLLATEASLSQGQYQLLSLARLFLVRPSIVILDEATSSLDTRTEKLVQAAFERLMKGRTSFIIAHRLSTIQSADLILVMVDGQIVEQGRHDQLMAAQGVYYQMQQSKELAGPADHG